MHICYVDEAGDTGDLRTPTSPDQPVLVLLGIILPQPELANVTRRFLVLKRNFFPKRFANVKYYLDIVRDEIKGADVRKQVRSSSRNKRRHALGFLGKVVSLLEQVDARLVGRVWVKGLGDLFDGRAVYTSSMQAICSYTHAYVDRSDGQAFVVADSRAAAQNRRVAHAIFTQKFRFKGDPHPRVREMPTYGDSENHVGLQIADLVGSGIIYPMACHSFCTGHVHTVHTHANYGLMKTHFGKSMMRMQYRYVDGGRWLGGLTVSDRLTQRAGSHLFI